VNQSNRFKVIHIEAELEGLLVCCRQAEARNVSVLKASKPALRLTQPRTRLVRQALCYGVGGKSAGA
jgi:hypothetical protein